MSAILALGYKKLNIKKFFFRPNGQVWLRHNIFTVSAGVQISLGLKEISSVGRAVALHAKGQVFKSPISYKLISIIVTNMRINVIVTYMAHVHKI